MLLDMVGECDHQDSVFRDQADQGDQADLGVDVERGVAQPQRHQRATDGQRHRDQDHQRIAQALELRRQDQENHHQREAERHPQPVAFLHELTAVAEPVDAGAGRQRLRLQERDGLAHADAGTGQHDQRGRVHLAELGELIGLGPRLDAGDGGQRHQCAGDGLDVEAAQVFRRHPVVLPDLRDHVIGPVMEIEAVDVVLAHQHRQGFGDGLHGHAHFARLGAVDGDMRLLAVEGQVVLHVDEQAAGIGRRLDLLGGVIERLEVLRRAQHHLHRQAAAGARQRRELHGGQRFAVDRAAGRLYLALDLDGRARALGPVLQDRPAQHLVLPASGAADMHEAAVELGDGFEDLLDPGGVARGIAYPAYCGALAMTMTAPWSSVGASSRRMPSNSTTMAASTATPTSSTAPRAPGARQRAGSARPATPCSAPPAWPAGPRSGGHPAAWSSSPATRSARPRRTRRPSRPA